MSVSIPVGIDLGNASAVLGVARNRGIDIVVNEVSNRSTPAMVGFGHKARALGEGAKSQETSNIKNTVSSLKRLIGQPSTSPALDVEREFNQAKICDVQGYAGVQVRYAGEQREFTYTQLTAMFLSKLKTTLVNDTRGTISDVVLSVPAYFDDAERRAVIDAARIAGLNPVRLVNDTTAAAVGYGVFRTDHPEEGHRSVAIVDIGHSDYTVSIVQFRKTDAKVLATVTERNFGGRIVDLAITKHMAKVFLEKYKIDIRTNPKAFARVLSQSEKVKKILSANTSAQFNVESLMEDIDVSAVMQREELEEYLEPYLANLKQPIQAALKTAGLTVEDLDAVELIGGCTRVPSVKEKISEAFNGKALSYTLNQDEAVARGAAFLCAAHSPTVRVRPYKMEDFNQFGVTFKWEKTEDEDVSELEAFPAGSAFPSTKMITLYRKGEFYLEAQYTGSGPLAASAKPFIGRWFVKGVQPNADGSAVPVKMKIRQDPSGLYILESAAAFEEVQVQEPVPVPEGEEKPEEPVMRTVQKLVKKADLEIVYEGPGLDEEALNVLIELEASMSAQDKLVADTEDRKNALEEYIYEIRDKLEDQYAEFASDQEKERLRALTDAAEEWLYSDGEDASKGQYIAKYEELASIGNLIKGRYTSKIEEERQAKIAQKEAEQAKIMAAKLQADKAAREAAAAAAEAETEAQAEADEPMNDQVD